MTTVYTQNQDRLILDDSDLVGAGGEGSVFKDPQRSNGLIKIYERPTKQHGQKLSDFIRRNFSLPKNVAAPSEVVFDSHGHIVGFRMPFFKDAFPFRKLSDRKYCLKQAISVKTISHLHLQQIDILNTLHPQGIVEGDLNDLNNLFKNNQAISIDVDSWQFNHWPCRVATENFLNPRLYGVDLSKKDHFIPEDDWYSFAVLLHRSLLKVHPYGGTHPNFNNLTARAQKRITVHDNNVIYPAVGLKPEVISDDLSHLFHQYFKQGKISSFPKPILDQFAKSLITCPSCRQEYPQNRRTCPTCREQNQNALNITIPGSITYIEKLKIKGQIVFHKLENNNTLLIVSVDNDIATFYIVSPYGTQKFPLQTYKKGMQIDASTKIVVTNENLSTSLNVYQIDNDHLRHSGQLITDVYSGNSHAMFRVNNQHIFHIIGSQLVDTTLFHGQFIHKPLRQVVENQTWFSSNNDKDNVCLGFYRVLRQQFFWLSREGFSTDLNLTFLETGERLLDISVKYSSKEILVQRHTKSQGKEYILMDHLDFSGNIVSSSKHEVSSLPSDNIHGLAFSKGSLIYPTDQGVIRLKLPEKSIANFSSTNKIVNSNHTLYLFEKGLLVVSENSIHQLILN